MLAISDRVVIRADDLLNWCDDTINWIYGLRANTLLNPTIKTESNENNVNNLDAVTVTPSNNKNESENNDEITTKNIRSLKNSKWDFTEVENEKGKSNLPIFINFIQ